MGFQSVYRTLQDLFPQVDARLLKAAAIEHSDDPDASVEFILTEVLPYTTEKLCVSTCTSQSLAGVSSDENERYFVPRLAVTQRASPIDHESNSSVGEAFNESGKMNKPVHVDPACLKEAACSFSGPTFYNADGIHHQLIENTTEGDTVLGEIYQPCHVDPICLNGTGNAHLQLTFYDEKDTGCQSSGNTMEVGGREGRINRTSLLETQCMNSFDPTNNDSNDRSDQNTGTEISESSSLLVEDAVAVQDMSLKNNSVSHSYEEVPYDDYISNIPSEKNDFTVVYPKFDLLDSGFSSLVSSAVLENDPPSDILNEPILVNGQKEHLSDKGLSVVSNYVDLTSLTLEDHRLESICSSIQSEVQNNMIAFDGQILEDHEVSNVAFSQDIQVLGSANIKESSSLHSVLTGSGQLCRTGLLQDIVEDSKTHKKTLLSAMESVLKLMKEVELEEEIAQQAKEEAAKAGFKIHAKVEELKKMLNRAREANDMNSGEVYGERAVLTTEMRELQSRLLVLSDEKDNSLAILNVMRQDLETRLASAEAERIEAEKEKSEKEESAQRALVEQELIMEKVVQESKTLQQEAEENAKLREFLVDRGHVVDSLQGEISVICADVKSIKEKYDAKVPLSACLSSKQTSCILASSGSSSIKSTCSEKRGPNGPSSNPSFPMLSVNQDSDQNESVEEGWELF